MNDFCNGIFTVIVSSAKNAMARAFKIFFSDLLFQRFAKTIFSRRKSRMASGAKETLKDSDSPDFFMFEFSVTLSF